MTTIKDVAKDAGVSIGTVSKVINGVHVRDEYFQRVEASIQKLNYRVNLNARGLKAQRTNDIAVIVPTLENPFFPPMVDAIEKELTERGKRMLICISRNDRDKLRGYIEMARNNRVDGIFGVTYSNIDDDILEHMPIVSFDRHFKSSIPCVASDNFAGGELAARTLAEKGCKKLLCFWTGSDYDCEPSKRIKGFQQYCLKNHIEHNVLSYMDYEQVDTGFMYISQMNRDMVRNIIHGHSDKGKFEFDGIFCSSDHLALIVKEELENIGIRVPQDVQIIGFDGIQIMNGGKPIVSSIQQPVAQIAQTGVSILLQLIEEGSAESVVDLPVRFVEGGTTRQ